MLLFKWPLILILLRMVLGLMVLLVLLDLVWLLMNLRMRMVALAPTHVFMPLRGHGGHRSRANHGVDVFLLHAAIHVIDLVRVDHVYLYIFYLEFGVPGIENWNDNFISGRLYFILKLCSKRNLYTCPITLYNIFYNG